MLPLCNIKQWKVPQVNIIVVSRDCVVAALQENPGKIPMVLWSDLLEFF